MSHRVPQPIGGRQKLLPYYFSQVLLNGVLIGRLDEPAFNYTIIRVSPTQRPDKRPLINAEVGGHLTTDTTIAKYHSKDWKQAVDWVQSIVMEED
ncbi:hypothetical protein BH10PSE7_BH10PSE7_33300 [soil metagenome]